MPVWLMVVGGLFLVGLVVSFVIVEWRSSHGTLSDRRGGTIDRAGRRKVGEGPHEPGGGLGAL